MRSVSVVIFFAFLLGPPRSHAEVDVLSPAQDGLVLGRQVRIILAGCREQPRVQATVGPTVTAPRFAVEAYRDRWIARLTLSAQGPQVLTLRGRCGARKILQSVRFRNDVGGSVEVADDVLRGYLAGQRAERLDWSWGPGVLLYGLVRFAPLSVRREQYLSFVRDYHAHHARKGIPRIDQADRCAPALSAFALFAELGDGCALANLDPVVAYLRSAPRNSLGSLDHLGQGSLGSLFFPGSIWVDSLMMWGLLSWRVAQRSGLSELASLARAQPFVFQRKLQDPETGLFHHAWNLERDQLLPRDNAPWLRGNGWVLTYLVELLDGLSPADPLYPGLIEIISSLARAVLPFRQPSGYWDTVLDGPGYAYEEASGSALLAYGLAKGARLGALPPEDREIGKSTFQAIVARMKQREHGHSLEEISAGTNPSNRFFYSIVPTAPNLTYGLGAFLLLAAELSADGFVDLEAEEVEKKGGGF